MGCHSTEEDAMVARLGLAQHKASLSDGERHPTRRPTTVLLVDDDEGIRHAMQRMLASAGYEVIEAANASEALAAIDTFGRIGVLITDIVMPGMHGDDLALVVRHELPQIGVLVISGYGDARALDSRLEKRGCRFLAKPFAMQTFLDVVAELVPVWGS
jgi:two-component system cell cycle sensor histidine kinase/response regulator CckA